jgi:hypothetical protein
MPEHRLTAVERYYKRGPHEYAGTPPGTPVFVAWCTCGKSSAFMASRAAAGWWHRCHAKYPEEVPK